MAKQHRATEDQWRMMRETASNGGYSCSVTVELADRVERLEKLSAIHATRMMQFITLECRIKALENAIGALTARLLTAQLIDPEEARNLGFIPAEDARAARERVARQAAKDAADAMGGALGLEQLSVRVDGMQYGPLSRPPVDYEVTWKEDQPTYTVFNINSSVYVRLTEIGRAIVRDEGTVYQSDKEEDVEGYTKWQLWELMYLFGRHLYKGCKAPFETTIRLTNERI
jgi:hypothetical protein